MDKNCIFVSVFMCVLHGVTFSIAHCNGFFESAGIILIGAVIGFLIGFSVFGVFRLFERIFQRR